MDTRHIISQYGRQPLSHQLLVNVLKDYRRPNDKIKALKAEGVLEAVRKGLYIAGPQAGEERPERVLIANHILGPSYVSADTALAYYGLIPERVYAVSSMTTKASRAYETPQGRFTYTRLPLPYYAFGLTMVKLSEDGRAIFASPEKAVCDKIVTTAGVLIRSIRGAYDYLVDDLRMDEAGLKQFDTGVMKTWLNDAPKRESLQWVIKMIESL